MATLKELETRQPHGVRTLRAALQANRLHHAYLLLGQEADECVAVARAAALALLCHQPVSGSSCETCPGCRKAAGGNHPDLHELAPNEKGNIPIDAVRDANSRLALRAHEAPRSVVLICSADRMRAEAQNALLKTLEEPPGPACFLLTAQRRRMVLPTVRSRCQHLAIRPNPDHAHQQLLSAGVAPAHAPALRALLAGSTASAEDLVSSGASDILAALLRALQPTETQAGSAAQSKAAGATARTESTASLLALARDLGQDRAKYELALALLEVIVRDRLAALHGASAAQLAAATMPNAESGTLGNLGIAVDRIQNARQNAHLYPNKTLVLEQVMLAITGQVSSNHP